MPTQQRFNIIYNDNGQGLSRDARVVQEALRSAGFRTWLTALSPRQFPRSLNYTPERALWTARSATRRVVHAWARRARFWDVNIFIETIVPEYLASARVNCLVPNQEWLSPDDLASMRSVDIVLCKTAHAVQALSSHARASAFIGFTSLDRSQPRVTRHVDAALHVAGWNPHKGTAAVIGAWLDNPAWPGLTVVAHREPLRSSRANIDLLTARVPDRQLRRLQNACGVHVCPSEVEGFGHTLMEGMSCGAVVVTTAAPPMDELVSPDEGFLVPYAAAKQMGSGTRYIVEKDRLADVLRHVWSLDGARLRSLGAAARARYENGRAAFQRRLVDVVRGL